MNDSNYSNLLLGRSRLVLARSWRRQVCSARALARSRQRVERFRRENLTMKAILTTLMLLVSCSPVFAQQQQQQQQQPPQPKGQPPARKDDQPKPRPKVERRKKSDERADPRQLLTLDGKVRPPDTAERDEQGRVVAVYEEDPREAEVGDVVELERPNPLSRWNPTPVTPADVGYAYLVHSVWKTGEVVLQPRAIARGGQFVLGKPFVAKGLDAAGLKRGGLADPKGKWRVVGTVRNKYNSVFFVLESVAGSPGERGK